MDPNATTVEIEAARLSREQSLQIGTTHDALTRVMRVLDCTPATAAGLLRQAFLRDMAKPPAQREGLANSLAAVMAARFPLLMRDKNGRLTLAR
jgi:hypothetical protein